MISSISTLQHTDVNGVPLSNGKIVVLSHSLTTGSTHTFADELLTMPRYEFQLDSRGSAKIWIDDACKEDVYLYDEKGKLVNSWIGLQLGNDGSDISAHIANFNNPHRVTAEQVGSYTKSESDNKYATQASLNSESANRAFGDSQLQALINAEVANRILADSQINASITSHVNDHNNPHQVTAEQIGSYEKDETYNREEVDQHIASAMSGVGRFLGVLSPTEVNALTNIHNGDYCDISESGEITLGSLIVVRGDVIVYDGEEWQKRLNIEKGLRVTSGCLYFG